MMRRLLVDTRWAGPSRYARRLWNSLDCRLKGMTSHATKEATVLSHAADSGIRIFLETGTYMGDMVAAVMNRFDRLYSVEVDEALASRARKIFERRLEVRIIEGDSATVLPAILDQLTEPALVWLDAHYSGGVTGGSDETNPVLQELSHVLQARQSHVILMDDARCFDGTQGYPSLESIEALVRSRRPDYDVRVADDIIRVLPATSRAGGQ